MEIEIRKTDEFEKALEIAKSLPDYFTQQGLDEIQSQMPTHSVWGAYDGDKLVGCVSYKKLNDFSLDMTWLFVAPDFHSKNIGTQLVLQSLEEEGKDCKVCQIKTLAETVEDEGYARTRKFYQKVGFVPIQIVDPYPGWGPENPCQIMVKFLNA